jgi:hypothetical protein
MNQQHERYVDVTELVDDEDFVIDERTAFFILFPPTFALIVLYLLTEMIMETIRGWL